jgi:hypothetical protein
MRSPKSALRGLEKGQLERAIKAMADEENGRLRLKQFFVNEYYPAIIHTSGKMVILEKTIESLIEREALGKHDREIVNAVVEAFPEWFTQAA